MPLTASTAPLGVLTASDAPGALGNIDGGTAVTGQVPTGAVDGGSAAGVPAGNADGGSASG